MLDGDGIIRNLTHLHTQADEIGLALLHGRQERMDGPGPGLEQGVAKIRHEATNCSRIQVDRFLGHPA